MQGCELCVVGEVCMRVIYGGGGVCMRGHFEREGEVLLLNQRKLEFFLEAYSSFFLLSLRFLQPLVLLNVFLFFLQYGSSCGSQHPYQFTGQT